MAILRDRRVPGVRPKLGDNPRDVKSLDIVQLVQIMQRRPRVLAPPSKVPGSNAAVTDRIGTRSSCRCLSRRGCNPAPAPAPDPGECVVEDVRRETREEMAGYQCTVLVYQKTDSSDVS